jgi:hypothetical protein
MSTSSVISGVSNKRRHCGDESTDVVTSVDVARPLAKRLNTPELDYPGCVCTAAKAAQNDTDGPGVELFANAVSFLHVPSRVVGAVRACGCTCAVIGHQLTSPVHHSQISARNDTVMQVLEQVFEAHVGAVARELEHGGKAGLSDRISAALTSVGRHSRWLPFVHSALLEVFFVTRVDVHPGELVVVAEHLTSIVVGVARTVAPAKVAAAHAAAVAGSGDGGRMRAVMARRVARRTLDNLVAAAAKSGAKQSPTSLETALRALTRAPHATWDSFVLVLDDAVAARNNLGDACVPVASSASAVVKTRDVRQAWLQVISTVEVTGSTQQTAVAFVQPYLFFVREFMRLREEILRKMNK